MIEKLTGDVEDPVKSAFPDMPEPPLPSTFKTSELAGTYSDPGYGELRLYEEPHPKKPEEKILVASRPDYTWRYQVRLQHATVDYWVVHTTVPENPTVVNDFQPGKFTRGADGKVCELKIVWGDRLGEGETVFKRVQE